MIYFLVNNDYQLIDARRHLIDLSRSGQACRLIEIPHSLNTPNRGEGFEQIHTLPSPLKNRSWIRGWPQYWNLNRQIKSELRPGPDDVLVLFTEYELGNHLIARHFKASGARVYLLEDGGLATYLLFSALGREPLTAKESLIAAMSRCIPGLRTTGFLKLNGVIFPCLPDEVIDAVCVYRPIISNRCTPIRLLKPHVRPRVEPTKGRAVFLNQPLHEHYYTSFESYLNGLAQVLEALTRGFTEPLFKFHPRETEASRTRIRQLLAEQFPTIRVIEDDRPFEQLATDLRPEVLASYFSTALLNIAVDGIEPLYLYSLLPDLAKQPICAQTTVLLESWGYNTIRDVAQVRSGYRSQLADESNSSRVSLAVIVSKNC